MEISPRYIVYNVSKQYVFFYIKITNIKLYLQVPDYSQWLYVRMQILLVGNFQVLVNMFLYDLKLVKNNMHIFMDNFVVILNNLL